MGLDQRHRHRSWTPKHWLLVLIPMIAAAGIFAALKLDRPDLVPVHVGSLIVHAEVVTTPDAQQRGLSGRRTLAPDRGMLFVFDRPDRYCFWMKDMKFDLDILWLDDHKNVVFMERDIAPSTYPRSFCPDQPARYVLEINGGLAERASVQVGDQITFVPGR